MGRRKPPLSLFFSTVECVLSEVVPLQVVPKEGYKNQTLDKFDEWAAEMRTWLSQQHESGFVFLAYSRSTDPGDGERTLSTWCKLTLDDPADGFWLPDAAKVRIYNRIHDD